MCKYKSKDSADYAGKHIACYLAPHLTVAAFQRLQPLALLFLFLEHTFHVGCQLLNLSRERPHFADVFFKHLRQLRDEGILSEARPGLYDLKASVSRYINYLGGAARETLNAERAGLTKAKREATELENKLRQGEVHSTEDIETGIKTMCLNIRSRLLTLPAKLSPALAAMGNNQGAIFDALKEAIDENLEALHNYDVAFAVDGEETNEQ